MEQFERRCSMNQIVCRHEVVNINLADKPGWLLEKNPSGTVPLLEIEHIDGTTSESTRLETVIG